MLTRLMSISMLGGLILYPIVSFAHHSFAAEFLADEWVTIDGVITEVWFKNPHVRYYLESEDESGIKIRWDARTNAASIMQRAGWNKNSIIVGDRLTVKGNRGRRGKKLLSITTVTFPDGRVFTTKPGSISIPD